MSTRIPTADECRIALDKIADVLHDYELPEEAKGLLCAAVDTLNPLADGPFMRAIDACFEVKKCCPRYKPRRGNFGEESACDNCDVCRAGESLLPM